MTATAERVLEDIKTLPPADLRTVWQRVSEVLNSPPPPPGSREREALEAVYSLYGRFAGGDLLVHLLQERTHDRAREDEQLRGHLSRHNG